MRAAITKSSRVLGLGLVLAACGSGDRVLTGDESPIDARDAGHTTHAMDAQTALGDPTDAAGPRSDGGAHLEHVASDPECDMNGLWAARHQTVNVALSLPQTANNWYYYELAQDGEQLTVVDHYDCGIEVLGTAHVQITRQATEVLIGHNRQQGRRGTFEKTADGTCAFELERFWSVRGANEANYLPNATRDSNEAMAQVAARLPLPTANAPAGAEDWDGDGELGIAWHVSGLVSGVRNSVQRDWTHFFTDDEFTIAPSRDFTEDLVMRSEFDAEESVIDPTFGTLASGSKLDNTVKHRITFRFLGRDASDARAKALLESSKLDTCYAIQAALPASEL